MFRQRRLAAAGIAIAVSALGALASSAPATAHLFRGFGFAVGHQGAGNLEFNAPKGIAVEQTTGDVYVADTGNNRVQVVSGSGEYLNQFSGSGTPAKSFLEPEWLAVDNSPSGTDLSQSDVYVADNGHEVIDKFTSTGTYINQLNLVGDGDILGLAVGREGNLWVYTAANPHIREYNDEVVNGPVRQWGWGYGTGAGLVVTSADEVYAVIGGSYTEHVQQYSQTGQEGTEYRCNCVGVGINEANNEIYFIEAPLSQLNSGTFNTGEGKGGRIVVGNEAFGEGGLGNARDMAINSNLRTLYAADTERDDIFVIPATEIDLGSVSNFKQHSAEANATVDGFGFDTHYVVEYGPSEGLGAVAPEGGGDAGSGPANIKVPMAGLEPGQLYFYRVSTSNPLVGTFFSELATFLTPPAVVGAPHATGVTSFAATLSGTIENPGSVTPTYHFVYGTTTKYGQDAPATAAEFGIAGEAIGSAENDDATASVPVSGLRPSTTYHYALVATNVGGGESIGPDETFTTRPDLPPIVSTGSAADIEEQTANLTGTIDAQGLPTTYFFEYGTTTGYGSTWPTIVKREGEPPLGEAKAGEANGPAGVLISVQNLHPGTTYHYRLVATNEDGTSYGGDQTFTAQGYPISVVPETPKLSTELGIKTPQGPVSTGKGAKHKAKGKAHRKSKGKGKGKKPKKKGKG